jgi:hypothetical protein
MPARPEDGRSRRRQITGERWCHGSGGQMTSAGMQFPGSIVLRDRPAVMGVRVLVGLNCTMRLIERTDHFAQRCSRCDDDKRGHREQHDEPPRPSSRRPAESPVARLLRSGRARPARAHGSTGAARGQGGRVHGDRRWRRSRRQSPFPADESLSHSEQRPRTIPAAYVRLASARPLPGQPGRQRLGTRVRRTAIRTVPRSPDAASLPLPARRA